MFFTANETIFQLGQLQSEESILIHAGGSGVGTAGIQLAQCIGAKVYVTAGSDEKIKRCQTLGALGGVNYKRHDFAPKILELTEGAGVDVIEDFIGAKYLAGNLSLLKTGGRLIVVGLMGGRVTEIDLSLVLKRHLQIKATTMRPQPLSEKRKITKHFVQRWLPEFLKGKIKPVVDRVFPFEEVEEAHDYLEGNRHFGKLVLLLRE